MSILFTGIILFVIMVANIQSGISNDGNSIGLNLNVLMQNASADSEDGIWNEVRYTTYPPEINCSGSGDLECKWPQ